MKPFWATAVSTLPRLHMSEIFPYVGNPDLYPYLYRNLERKRYAYY